MTFRRVRDGGDIGDTGSSQRIGEADLEHGQLPGIEALEPRPGLCGTFLHLRSVEYQIEDRLDRRIRLARHAASLRGIRLPNVPAALVMALALPASNALAVAHGSARRSSR